MNTLAGHRAQNPALLARVEAGESLVLVLDGRPVAELRPLPAATAPPAQRPYGLAAGQFVVPDDFDAPLPEDVLKEFGV